LDANKGTGFDRICFRPGRAALMVAAGAVSFPRSQAVEPAVSKGGRGGRQEV
jgi:hypothetical protein